jgi:Tfp pilus assembly protein PilN
VKGNALSSELLMNQSAINRYDTLKKEYSRKKDFLEANGLLESSQTSFYADRLASELPSSIQWNDLLIHPIRKKDQSDESNSLFFENKLIRISGKCARNTELNEWMKKTKKKDWISNVTLLDYKQENATDAGKFIIEIRLK